MAPFQITRAVLIMICDSCHVMLYFQHMVKLLLMLPDKSSHDIQNMIDYLFRTEDYFQDMIAIINVIDM